MLACILVAHSVRQFSRGTSSSTAVLVVSGILLVYMPVVVFLLFRYGGRAPNAALREMMLRHDLCPCCAGDLAGAAPDRASGRVRCPTCAAEWARHAWLYGGACASCGYALQGLPANEDGFTMCPECGAGWMVGGVAAGHGHDAR